MTAKKMNVTECKNSESIVTKALVLVLAIFFKSSIGIGVGSTFCQSVIIDIDNSFHKHC